MQASDRLSNLLGAFALALGDEIFRAVRAQGDEFPNETAALVEIATWPDETIDSLARSLRLSAAGTTRLVDRLARRGLVERAVGAADRRSRTLAATEAGRARASAILAGRRAAIEGALAALSPEERALLEPLLERMLASLTPDRATCDHTCRLCDVAACPSDVCPVEQAARAKDR